MRKLQIVALSFLLSMSALPSRAQAGSWGCVYMIMSHAHAAAAACGAPLDSEHEANYVTLHAALEQFIRTNASSNPDGLLSALQRSSQLLPQENVCDPSFKRSLETMTGSENAAKIQEAMKIPSDPMAGGCI